MSLLTQIQTLAMSFLMGMIYGFLYAFLNRCLLKVKWLIIHLFCDIIFNMFFMTCFFYLLLYLNHGALFIYHGICLLLGIYYYLIFLSKGYLRMVEGWMKFFRWIFLPFNFSFKKIHDILKSIKKVRRYGNKKKSQ